MDLLTQGLLGAAMAQTVARRDETGRASFIGFLSGLVADADVLIQSSSDPLFMLEYHRHFTHSIFFIPLGALLVALILWPIFRTGLSFSRLYIFAILGFSLSGFIDTCTSYGTYLLWPLINERISFHIISIVDPVFTFVLLVAVLLSYAKKRNKVAVTGLLFCGSWLLLGWWQHERAESFANELAVTRGHIVEKLLVKPTLGNLLLWRSTYISGQHVYVDAIRLGLTDKNRVYQGSSIALFLPERHLEENLKDSVLYQDVVRFNTLIDGYLALHPSNNNLLGDLRYSLLPNSLEPLWAIRLNRSIPDKHVKYEFFRNTDKQTRQKFLDMLLGKDM